jgi:hypothetical protein
MESSNTGKLDTINFLTSSMADYVSNVKFKSWEDYYLVKKEEKEGYFQDLALKKLSAFDSLPSGYFNHPENLKDVVEAFLGGNFLLIPAGGNLVRCIHHCFEAYYSKHPVRAVQKEASGIYIYISIAITAVLL